MGKRVIISSGVFKAKTLKSKSILRPPSRRHLGRGLLVTVPCFVITTAYCTNPCRI